MPLQATSTIVLDNDFLVSGWENGRKAGNPSQFLDAMIDFYRRQGYDIVTNEVVRREFLYEGLPPDLLAERQAWWDGAVESNRIDVRSVPNSGKYVGVKNGGELSLIDHTIPSLANNGDLSHIRMYSLEDFLRKPYFQNFLDAHPEITRQSFIQDWAGDFAERIRLGDEIAAQQVGLFDDVRRVGSIENGVNRGLMRGPNGAFIGSSWDEAINAHWDLARALGNAQVNLHTELGPSEFAKFFDLTNPRVAFWYKAGGEAIGAAAVLLDAYLTKEDFYKALADGDLVSADEILGGLLGRAFGGAFLGVLSGAAAGSAFGLPGAIVGAIVGGLVGAYGGGEIGEWLFGTLGEMGAHISELVRSASEMMRELLGDPIVLDLDGDGIELIPLASSTVRFDLDGDGLEERVGWVSAQDGLLVHDKNGNGVADSVDELFGSANVDGYDELEQLDTNSDGKISSLDVDFANLKVWRDLNQDGISTSDEMLSLAQAGIAQFNLGYTQLNVEAGGNVTAREGSYTRTDNVVRSMASVWFGMDESVNRLVIPGNADLSGYYPLPNLPAAASMPDLWTAMYFDPVLKAMVENLASSDFDFFSFADFAGLAQSSSTSTLTSSGGGGGSTSVIVGADPSAPEIIPGRFIEILYRWAGVDTAVAEDPAHPWHVQVFEAITGIPLVLTNGHQREQIEAMWTQLVGQMGANFLVQAANKPLITPLYGLALAIAELDPEDPDYLETVAVLGEAALADVDAIPPASPFLAPFRLLSINSQTGEIEGDFDAFVYAFTATEEPFSTGGRPIGTGGATETYGAWLAWYQNYGKFLYSIASAMGISAEYVERVTGWRWKFGALGTVEGTSGDDVLEQEWSPSTRTVTPLPNGSISITTTSQPSRDQALYGYAGNDELRGLDGVDRLVGGMGNDLLKGGSGSDMYVYAIGDGSDRITDESGAEDVIYFSSELRSENMVVWRPTGTNDLFLHFGDPLHGITLTDQWSSNGNAIEQFHFVGQDGLDAGDITSRYLSTLVTTGNDVLAGSWADEVIYAQDGHDTINAGSGNDTLYGGAGDDTLSGQNGADVISGGLGNDYLDGSSGADAYLYTSGDGDDVIFDEAWDDNETLTKDTLHLGGGITADDLLLSNVADDWNSIRIGFVGQNGSIKILGQHSGGKGIESVIFSDESNWTLAELTARYVSDQQTVGHDLVHGSHFADSISSGAGDDVVISGYGNDAINGGAGNDYLQGGNGADTYTYNVGDGHDIIFDDAIDDNEGGVRDTIVFGEGITAADLRFSNYSDAWNDIKIHIAGEAGSIRIRDQNSDYRGVEAFNFSDGSILNLVQLMARYVSDQQTVGHDLVHGTNFSDTISSGAGNDVVISGYGGDVITGGAGDDYLQGGYGAETYVYNLGDGHDIIFDYAIDDDEANVKDTISFGYGIQPEDILIEPDRWNNSSNMLIRIAGQPGSILVAGQSAFRTGIELIRFYDGTIWNAADIAAQFALGQARLATQAINGTSNPETLNGTAADDRVFAEAGNDTLIGGTGDDFLSGGYGDDTYIFNPGDGQDTIFEDEDSNWNGGTDTIRFGLGISLDDFVLSKTTQDWLDVRITITGTGDSILLDGQDAFNSYGSGLSYNRIENFVFQHEENGSIVETTVTWADLNLRRLAQAKTAGNDTIIGTNFADAVDGGAGEDTLYGWTGNDTLIGGTGDDFLSGGYGDDTYIFNSGDGQDTIFEDEDSNWNGGTDTIRFGLGISLDDFVLSKTTQDWLDVRITITGTGDSILLDGQDAFNSYGSGLSYNRIENFVFQHEENGSIVETTVTWSDLNLRRLAQAKTAGNDTIIGTNFADAIDGGAGGDTLHGWTGNDTLTGGAGNDSLDGGAGSDRAFFFGHSATYSLKTSAGVLHITDNAQQVDGNDGTDSLKAIEWLRFGNGEEIGITSPIILDLDGGGVTTVSASAAQARYDMDGDGVADRTSWMGRGEGMLFIDRDGNGTLSNAGEFSFVNDVEGAASDLVGLRAFDSDEDGTLSSADDRFADFRIWRDDDGDGAVDHGEILSLASAGVQSLGLSGNAVESTVALGDVVTINTGSFTRTDGSSAAFIDAALTYFSGVSLGGIASAVRQHKPLSRGQGRDGLRRLGRERRADWQYALDPIAHWPQRSDQRMRSGGAILAIDDRAQPIHSLPSAATPASSMDRQLVMMVQEMNAFGAKSAAEGLGQWQRENVRPFDFFA